MNGLAVYVKEGLPAVPDFSLENSADSHVFDWLFILSYFFFLYRSPSCSLSTVFDSQMRFSGSTHELMFLSQETLTSIIRNGLPTLVELADLVNSVIIFLFPMTLLRWLTFLLTSQNVILSPALLEFFLFSDASICSAMAFPLLGNSDHVVISVPIDFHQIHNRMPRFNAQLMTILVLIEMVFMII